MNNSSALVLKYHRYMKTRLFMLRIMGLLMSVLCIVLLIIQYLKVVDSIWNCVSILYMCGFIFTLNGQYQDVCRKKGFAKASRFFAVLLYLATLAVLVLILLNRFAVITL